MRRERERRGGGKKTDFLRSLSYPAKLNLGKRTDHGRWHERQAVAKEARAKGEGGDVKGTTGELVFCFALPPSLSFSLYPDPSRVVPTNPQIASKMPLIFDTAPPPSVWRRLACPFPSLSGSLHTPICRKGREFRAGLRARRSPSS